MAETLGRVLAAARVQRGWSLREVERLTGISNAHLSQIETGSITRPDTYLLWTLADTYELDFDGLMLLAGRIEPRTGNRASLTGVAFKTLQSLTPAEQEEALRLIEDIRRRRADPGDADAPK